MTLPVRLLAAVAGLVCATSASAELCRTRPADREPAHAAAPCRPEDRVEPYDPDRVKTGREPGFIDLGGGTEVRVGGRVRMDYGTGR